MQILLEQTFVPTRWFFSNKWFYIQFVIIFIRQLLIAINEIGFYYLIIRFIWYLNYYDRGCPHRFKQSAHYNQGCQLVGTHDAIEITMFQANNFFCDTFVRMCLHHVISYIFLPFNQGAEPPALIGSGMPPNCQVIHRTERWSQLALGLLNKLFLHSGGWQFRLVKTIDIIVHPNWCLLMVSHIFHFAQECVIIFANTTTNCDQIFDMYWCYLSFDGKRYDRFGVSEQAFSFIDDLDIVCY